MRKFLMIFVAFSMSAGLFAQQRVGNVVKVQGHVHELLTKQAAEGKLKITPRQLVSLGDVNPGSVQCWAGNPSSSLPIDSAYLLVKWTDGKRELLGDSLLIWGYRWNPISVYEGDTSSITVHSIDMIRAVANKDRRFTVLLQYAGISGYTVGGFGYNFATCSRVPLFFNYYGAEASSNVQFNYVTSPNTGVGQVAIPPSPQAQAAMAIDIAAGLPSGTGTGIIDHPFNVFYGYPAYDYDWWKLYDLENEDFEWQAGWSVNGFWSFYVGENKAIPTNFSNEGISYRVLTSHSTDGFVFATDFVTKEMSGDITGNLCNCIP
ncbi:MAG: hypothetical protein PHG27_04625 [Massilibacteroides sp.]|nr:hypothetical protein [Massilibacteroides sp.]MDD4114870.1 hypothetical protein [Massilibacteroides sp.]